MPKIAVLNMEGQQVGEMELSENIFASTINEAAMHLVVRSYLAAQRQGTQSAKPAARFAEAAGRSTVRRAPATHVTMATALPSSSTAAWCSLPSPAIM